MVDFKKLLRESRCPLDHKVLVQELLWKQLPLNVCCPDCGASLVRVARVHDLMPPRPQAHIMGAAINSELIDPAYIDSLLNYVDEHLFI